MKQGGGVDPASDCAVAPNVVVEQLTLQAVPGDSLLPKQKNCK